MTGLRRAAATVAAGLGLVVLAACDDSATGKDGAPVGTLIGTLGVAQGSPLSVMTPDGRIDFSVTRPRHDLPDADEKYDHAVDGASLVGVSWTWDYRTALPVAGGPGEDRVEPGISLVAGRRAYSLDELTLTRNDPDATSGSGPLQYRGTAWVSVQGEPDDLDDPDDLAIAVEFDHKTQTVSVDDGNDLTADLDQDPVVRPLYHPGSAGNRVLAQGACAAPRVTRGYVLAGTTDSCRATVTSTPYQQQVGWADSDAGWRVVALQATPGAGVALGSARSSRGFFAFGDGELTVTLDGERPVATVDSDDAARVLVFPPQPDPGTGSGLKVVGTYPTDGSADDDAGPTDPDITVTWRTSTF